MRPARANVIMGPGGPDHKSARDVVFAKRCFYVLHDTVGTERQHSTLDPRGNSRPKAKEKPQGCPSDHLGCELSPTSRPATRPVPCDEETTIYATAPCGFTSVSPTWNNGEASPGWVSSHREVLLFTWLRCVELQGLWIRLAAWRLSWTASWWVRTSSLAQ